MNETNDNKSTLPMTQLELWEMSRKVDELARKIQAIQDRFIGKKPKNSLTSRMSVIQSLRGEENED
jgi:hypothetical protein